jgi:hypothetical protein
MKSAVMIAFVVGVFGGCNKPTDEDCRKAIVNMQTLIGTANEKGNDLEGEVRRCRGGSKKEAVACAEKAATREQLDGCSFMTAPHKGKPPMGSGSAGSAAATGSAATGSAAASGSAAAGSGSAAK